MITTWMVPLFFSLENAAVFTGDTTSFLKLKTEDQVPKIDQNSHIIKKQTNR